MPILPIMTEHGVILNIEDLERGLYTVQLQSSHALKRATFVKLYAIYL
jgi:hypothetical protein